MEAFFPALRSELSVGRLFSMGGEDKTKDPTKSSVGIETLFHSWPGFDANFSVRGSLTAGKRNPNGNALMHLLPTSIT